MPLQIGLNSLYSYIGLYIQATSLMQFMKLQVKIHLQEAY